MSWHDNRMLERLHKSAAWRCNGVRAYARAYRALSGWERHQRFPVAIDRDLLPVIMCTYRRLEQLPRTLHLLAAQRVPVQVMIWDNSGDPEAVDKAVAGAHVPVTVHHSPRNIGGFGRFYLARAAAELGHKSVVFVDDDQEFGPEAVGDLLRGHRLLSLSGWFGFNLSGAGARQWSGAGERAHYVGTAGMICDTTVFRDSRLYRLPRRFWFIEDTWLCAFASNVSGYAIYRSSAQFSLVPDGRDQCLSLGWAKKRLDRWLRRHGMGLLQNTEMP
jgi:hypothetical protein